VRRANWCTVHADFELATGHPSEAGGPAEEALAIARSAGNPSALAMALYAYGWAIDADDPDGARAAYEEAIEVSRSGASDATLTPALSRVAPLRLGAGDVAGATAALREAVMYSRDIGDRGTMAWLIPMAAHIAFETGLLDAVPVLMGIAESELVAPLWAGIDESSELRAAAASRLGTQAYEAGVARGASLPYDDAVVFALETLDLAGQ
jgi:hypothetical protein